MNNHATHPQPSPPSAQQSASNHPFRYVLGLWFVVVFLSLGLLAWLCMFWPIERHRRISIHLLSRWIFVLGGARIHVSHLDRIPKGPCIVVANHQSYLDGPLLRAVLPPSFNFVIKNGMREAPLAGFLLTRIGSEFVDRTDRHQGGVDAKRFFKKATLGATWVIFPEGTFDHRIGLLPFLPGAFGAARHAGLPIVTVAIQGTRRMLPTERWWPCPGLLSCQVLSVYPPPSDRSELKEWAHRTRLEIAQAVQEPLLDAHREN
jgi:1-acyl-sn-glycerol-3-phosphate acyltransferase